MLDKHFPNSFLGTGLREYLIAQNVQRIIVCGMMTHMCIDTTVRAAQDYNFRVTLLEDACAGTAQKWGNTLVSYPMVHELVPDSVEFRKRRNAPDIAE